MSAERHSTAKPPAAVQTAAAAGRAKRGPGTLDPAAVLRRRARELARPLHAVDIDDATPPIDFLTFEIAGQTYAVEATAVREAVQPTAITPLPGLPATLRGLVNVRSRIVPAFDLRPVLNLRSRDEAAAAESLLIVAVGDTEFGLLVDALIGTRLVRRSEIRTDVAALQAQYLRGVAQDALLLLDLDAVAKALTIDDRSGPGVA